MALEPGRQAPDFSLQAAVDGRIEERPATLRGYRGRVLVLAFYPADWSPVCSDQLPVYNELLGEFRGLGAELAGLSVDGVWSHRAFGLERRLHYPLLADFEPKGEIARAYGVYRAKDGFSERALFVIDGAGKVFWSYVSPLDVNPGADGILEALGQLQARNR